jgi:hypothetical protein
VRPRLTELVEALFGAVPSGVGAHGFVCLSESTFRDVMVGGAGWCVAHGHGWPDDLVDGVEAERSFIARVPRGRSVQVRPTCRWPIAISTAKARARRREVAAPPSGPQEPLTTPPVPRSPCEYGFLVPEPRTPWYDNGREGWHA